ncbi:MAG: beta-lactamase family protein [Acidobacteria bacterium]|nr:beta-lactamase family protein [Acidobacteriota bacterium]
MFLVPWLLVWAWLAPLPSSIPGQADEAIRRGLDGIIVYVDQAGKEPQSSAAGWQNKKEQIPADPKALFKIASISKLYIAAATVKLVQAKKLSLDTPLSAYFPELQGQIEYADQINLRLMLQHRSGIPNFTDQTNFDWFNPPASDDQKLALVLGKPADFRPDSEYAYSNTNFLLIGRILDQTLGYAHAKYIKTSILDPLGLKHTFGSLAEVDAKDLVSGYWFGYEDDLKGIDFPTAGGSMIATAEEVAKFVRALRDGTLLSREEQALYETIYPYDHTGWLPGYQSMVEYQADMDSVVVVFVNTSGELAWNLHEIMYGRILKILRHQYR